ncbi:hypothetical protein PV433_10305 [Paenibacillus sp. GYB004]|uniref:DUF6906 family protein n=1 Tax=Paenibacillus sp. GYB004 TaxID=2994393 RepID=UPI002F96BC48
MDEGLAGEDKAGAIDMKQGKRPTRREMKVLAANGSNPENWLITKRLPGALHLVHRHTGAIKVIPIG